jgi:hypothetical protein
MPEGYSWRTNRIRFVSDLFFKKQLLSGVVHTKLVDNLSEQMCHFDLHMARKNNHQLGEISDDL